MKLIVPCGGKSSRFPNMRPKWMLTGPTGEMMVQLALRGLSFDSKDLILTFLEEHEARYEISSHLKKIFGSDVTLVRLGQPTSSQSETVARTLEQLSLTSAFLVKDSDNAFDLKTSHAGNFICYAELKDHPGMIAENKSYLKKRADGGVEAIREKQVISAEFCVGGYAFRSPDIFFKAFQQLNATAGGELYISFLVQNLIDAGEKFGAVQVTEYQDWGTLPDWQKFCHSVANYVVDIDGVLTKNSAQFFKPVWGTTEGLPSNVALLKELKTKGNFILLLTSRTEEFRAATEAQLKKLGIEYNHLIMGCLHARRFLINDFAATNAFPSAIAVNLERDSDTLRQALAEARK